jgi:DNA-binding IclR family transcriptional regulator
VKRRPSASASGSGQIKVLQRALAVLAAFDESQPCLRLSQASRELGMSKATLLRVLRTLQTHDFVRQRNEDHSFVLGPSAIRLGTLALRHTRVFEIARPYMRRLQATTGETVCFFVVSGTDRLCVDSIPSRHDLRMTADVGTTRPLHAGAAGKVLLAFMEEPAARRVLLGRRLQRLTDRTIADGPTVLRQLEEIRRNRYAVSAGEAVAGAAAIAAPILDRDESLVGALNVLGPQVRLTAARIKQLVPLAVETAEALSKELGYVQKP